MVSYGPFYGQLQRGGPIVEFTHLYDLEDETRNHTRFCV